MLWSPEINWETPAGEVLRRLVKALPQDRAWDLTVFGSSPLQLSLEASFTSADVDLYTVDEAEDTILRETVAELKLSRETADGVYIQVCHKTNFRTNPSWASRCHTVQVGHVKLRFPHPLDILIAKLPRLEEKDLRAYRLVIERMGIPTEEQMRKELQDSVDLFRPNFDEEMIGDITTNTAVLWQELWGKTINVRQEIIAPALARRRRDYDLDVPDRKNDLTRLAEGESLYRS